ncbi:hypothetical protein [Bradyrhizobium sp. RDI18]|uniref:hypothetical protein n=1 Tax=Bradyrhizobium sp. RDI18 TaxID=3367400 RepID=UPI003722C71E
MAGVLTSGQGNAFAPKNQMNSMALLRSGGPPGANWGTKTGGELSMAHLLLRLIKQPDHIRVSCLDEIV